MEGETQMELRLLHYFLAIADERNITKAARKLHVTQPTLSKQLSQLEDELEVTLFERRNRQMILTDAGVNLRERAAQIIELTNKTISEIKQTNEDIHGEIVIGSGETKGFSIIVDTLQLIQKEFPNITFNIFSGNGDDIMNRLDNGLVDFGLIIGKRNIDKYNSILLPYQDTWGVLMNKDDVLADEESITPQLLIDLPLIISRNPILRNELADWLGTSIHEKNVVASYNLIKNASMMAEKNLGYVLSLDGLVDTTGISDLCFKPLSPAVNANLYLIWRKNTFLVPAAKVFLEKMSLLIDPSQTVSDLNS